MSKEIIILILLYVSISIPTIIVVFIDFKTYGGKKAKEYVNKYVIKEKK